MSKEDLSVGDKVIAGKYRFDDTGPTGVLTITEVKDTSDKEGTTGQWVKTDGDSDWVDKAWFTKVEEQPDSQARDEQITYGVDMGAPDGDKTALSIKRGDTVYSFVGDEAEVILAYAERLATERKLYGRLHQVIELFQSGQLSAEAYSKLHSDITDRITTFTKEKQL